MIAAACIRRGYHLWDTEARENVTYTPPADFDTPWRIRTCCEHECDALLVTRLQPWRSPKETVTVFVPQHDAGDVVDGNFPRAAREGSVA